MVFQPASARILTARGGSPPLVSGWYLVVAGFVPRGNPLRWSCHTHFALPPPNEITPKNHAIQDRESWKAKPGTRGRVGHPGEHRKLFRIQRLIQPAAAKHVGKFDSCQLFVLGHARSDGRSRSRTGSAAFRLANGSAKSCGGQEDAGVLTRQGLSGRQLGGQPMLVCNSRCGSPSSPTRTGNRSRQSYW